MDRLQRRLAKVLGAKAGSMVRSREWRLVTPATAERASVARAWPPACRRRRPAHPEHGAPWGYEGRGGPQAWGRLKPEFGTCAKGQRQSPIDIRDGLALDLEPVLFDYRPSHFGVIDTGRTVQVNLAPGNFIDVNGRRFELQQFHFHRPSEERINGRQFDMNVHLVHRDADGQAGGGGGAAGAWRGAAAGADGVEQPAAGKGRGTARAQPDRPERVCCPATGATTPTWVR